MGKKEKRRTNVEASAGLFVESGGFGGGACRVNIWGLRCSSVTQPFPRQRGGKVTKCPPLPFGLICPDAGGDVKALHLRRNQGGGAGQGRGHGPERLAARVQEYSPMKVSTFCRGVLSALR